MKNNLVWNGNEYCTNDNDEGLFIWYEGWQGSYYRQLKGTCQFSVKNVKDKKGKIRKFLNKHYKDAY